MCVFFKKEFWMESGIDGNKSFYISKNTFFNVNYDAANSKSDLQTKAKLGSKNVRPLAKISISNNVQFYFPKYFTFKSPGLAEA